VAEESAARIAREVAAVLAGGRPTTCANPELLEKAEPTPHHPVVE
jgi:D-3-phosphoglycerate dehydrogenase